jgi:hypothetical protein
MTPPSFSERERGRLPRTTEAVDSRAWGGLVAIVSQQLARHGFAHDFPIGCLDVPGNVVATDEQMFALAFRDEVPRVTWPLWAPAVPEPSAIMDMIEFCCRRVAKVGDRPGGWHPFYGHHHLDFDVEAGRIAFTADINNWYARNGLAYELTADSEVRRLGPPVVRERLQEIEFDTGDPALDAFLERARAKYGQPDLGLRLEALKELWDAWERLKSSRIPVQGRKKESTERLLEQAAHGSPEFLAEISADAASLTSIGNDFSIRHSEVGKVAVDDAEHIDFMFGRLFNLVYLVVRSGQTPSQD